MEFKDAVKIFNSFTEDEFNEYIRDYSMDEIPSHPMTKKFIELINSSKKIIIWGDYDCDGMTGSTIFYKFIKNYLNKNVNVFLPSRKLGYGMNVSTIKKLRSDGFDLIITTDCGISNIEEIRIAREIGFNVIITDHHTVSQSIPNANIIIHPKIEPIIKESENFSGAGVAFWSILGISRELNIDFDIEWFAAVAAIGIIGDMTPLRGANRSIVKFGIKAIQNGKNKQIESIFKKTQIKSMKNIDEEDLAFQVIPRLNAAGRLKHPLYAFRLFVEENDETLVKYSEYLNDLNMERKEICDIYMNYFDENYDYSGMKSIVCADTWEHGIIGITAANICGKYKKPTFLISIQGDKGKGSARAFDGFNIYECLKYSESSLEAYGGHPAAGGFTIDMKNITKFTRLVEEYTTSQNVEIIDNAIKINDLSEISLDDYYDLKPFGIGFKSPEFIINEKRLVGIRALGRDGKHIQGKLGDYPAVGWRLFDESMHEMYDYNMRFNFYVDKYRRVNGKIKVNILNIERAENVKEGFY